MIYWSKIRLERQGTVLHKALEKGLIDSVTFQQRLVSFLGREW
jgi:hypothetical protein